MVRLYNKESGDLLGEITYDELQFLIDNLEEESISDTDYYIDRPTLEFLRDEGMAEHLVDLIEKAMGDKEEAEIKYEKT